MTQQYIAGELSLLLWQLQSVIAVGRLTMEVAQLRRRVEVGSRPELATTAIRALEVADTACWDSLTRGDAAAFIRQAATSDALWEFGVCSGLIEAP